MGHIVNKKIDNIRSYYDENDKVNSNYDLVFPITTFDAVVSSMGSNPTTLKTILDDLSSSVKTKQSPLPTGVPLDILTYSGREGVFNSLQRAVVLEPDRSRRSDIRIPTERAVGTALDAKAETAVLNTHIDDKVVHIISEERKRWDAMTPLANFSSHVDNMIAHITNDERMKWNAKADSLTVTNHINDINNPHRVTATQLNVYTKPQIDQMLESKETGFFNDMSIKYDGELGVEIVPYNANMWQPNYIINYGAEFPEVPANHTNTIFLMVPNSDYLTSASDYVKIWVKRPNLVWSLGQPEAVKLRNGDLFILYPNSELYMWLGGRFKKVTTSGV